MSPHLSGVPPQGQQGLHQPQQQQPQVTWPARPGDAQTQAWVAAAAAATAAMHVQHQSSSGLMLRASQSAALLHMPGMQAPTASQLSAGTLLPPTQPPKGSGGTLAVGPSPAALAMGRPVTGRSGGGVGGGGPCPGRDPRPRGHGHHAVPARVVSPVRVRVSHRSSSCETPAQMRGRGGTDLASVLPNVGLGGLGTGATAAGRATPLPRPVAATPAPSPAASREGAMTPRHAVPVRVGTNRASSPVRMRWQVMRSCATPAPPPHTPVRENNAVSWTQLPPPAQLSRGAMTPRHMAGDVDGRTQSVQRAREYARSMTCAPPRRLASHTESVAERGAGTPMCAAVVVQSAGDLMAGGVRTPLRSGAGLLTVNGGVVSMALVCRARRSVSCEPKLATTIAECPAEWPVELPAASFQPPTAQVLSLVPPPPLSSGNVVSIGARRYLLHSPLGSGTYSCVWLARVASVGWETEADGAAEVAIKEMKCGRGPGILPDATLQRTHYEVQVMQQLAAEAARSSGSSTLCAPRILDHQFWPLGPEAPEALLCRVAMTRCRGQPLCEWTEACRWRGEGWAQSAARSASFVAAAGSAAAVPEVLSQHEATAAYCTSFLAAALAARALLVQLGPTFQTLNGSIAMHRDVNARNLLVFSPDPTFPISLCNSAAPTVSMAAEALEFSVVDFGACVDAAAWVGNGEGSWQAANPTGDARYWGPASWARHLEGPDALRGDAALLRQYTRRLDMFAVAVCALEAMAALHTAECPSTPSSNGGELVEGVERLRRGWTGYWELAVHSFDLLSAYSHHACAGDDATAGQVWNGLLQANVPQALRDCIGELCANLSAAAEHLRRAPPAPEAAVAQWRQAADTLSALREMLLPEGRLEWADLPAVLSSSVSVAPPLGGSAEVCFCAIDEDPHDVSVASIKTRTPSPRKSFGVDAPLPELTTPPHQRLGGFARGVREACDEVPTPPPQRPSYAGLFRGGADGAAEQTPLAPPAAAGGAPGAPGSPGPLPQPQQAPPESPLWEMPAPMLPTSTSAAPLSVMLGREAPMLPAPDCCAGAGAGEAAVGGSPSAAASASDAEPAVLSARRLEGSPAPTSRGTAAAGASMLATPSPTWLWAPPATPEGQLAVNCSPSTAAGRVLNTQQASCWTAWISKAISPKDRGHPAITR